MHQLKEVDMLSAKMDLLMKKLDKWDNEKKEVMHKPWGVWRHWPLRKQLPWDSRGCELHQQQQYQLSSSTKSRMESAIEAQLPR
jgi:hypothetical protein